MQIEEQVGDWFFAVRPARNGIFGQYIAWCAKTPELGNGRLDIIFSVEVYAQFADTADDAMKKLKAEVLH